MELTEKQKKKLKKRDKMLVYGLKNKLVFPYPDILFDYLRPYCVGGFPASIMVLINEMCNGHCYDRAELMQLAFDDCQIVHADIESLRITCGEEFAEHAFVETPEFGGGKTWVVDTSIGLIYDKDFYYKIEKPKVNRVISKEQVMQSRSIQSIIASNFEEDKYSLTLTMPNIERVVEQSNHIGTYMYKDKVRKEIELFKKAIGYDAMVAEVESDMQLMFKDPQALDKKFGIVRDRYGREISRGGKPNPYYISPEEADAEQAYYESIKDDEEKMSEYLGKVCEKSLKQMLIEDEATAKQAQERLEEIKKNPTANFYERERR